MRQKITLRQILKFYVVTKMSCILYFVQIFTTSELLLICILPSVCFVCFEEISNECFVLDEKIVCPTLHFLQFTVLLNTQFFIIEKLNNMTPYPWVIKASTSIDYGKWKRPARAVASIHSQEAQFNGISSQLEH